MSNIVCVRIQTLRLVYEVIIWGYTKEVKSQCQNIFPNIGESSVLKKTIYRRNDWILDKFWRLN